MAGQPCCLAPSRERAEPSGAGVTRSPGATVIANEFRRATTWLTGTSRHLLNYTPRSSRLIGTRSACRPRRARITQGADVAMHTHRDEVAKKAELASRDDPADVLVGPSARRVHARFHAGTRAERWDQWCRLTPEGCGLIWDRRDLRCPAGPASVVGDSAPGSCRRPVYWMTTRWEFAVLICEAARIGQGMCCGCCIGSILLGEPVQTGRGARRVPVQPHR